MKRFRFLLLILLVSLAFEAQAQISVGLKTGYTRAWEYYGVPVPDDAEIHVQGFNISALAYLRLNDFISIGFEPGYVERGAACVPGWNSGIDPTFVGDTELFLKYVELPLMVRGKLPVLKGKFELSGKVGYGVAFMSSAFEERITLDGSAPPVRSKLNLGEGTRLDRWDNGVHGGLGLGYKLKAGTLFFEYAYFASFENADRQLTSENRSANFSLGYLLDL